MSLTDEHAKYIAHELTLRRADDSVEKLTGALIDAQVDLNPHQIDAALFAFRSPLASGALLADEVGLGKTIEAGLVISQKWAERKRRILVITPANLRKQWFQELTEKFFLPCFHFQSYLGVFLALPWKCPGPEGDRRSAGIFIAGGRPPGRWSLPQRW